MVVSTCSSLILPCTAKRAGPSAGWRDGGSISQLEIGPNGELKMLDRHICQGFHRPLGDGGPERGYRKICCRDTIFATTGSAPMATDLTGPHTDPKRHKPKIIAINPDNGVILGEISSGADSVFAKISGGPAPSGQRPGLRCEAGNLYIVDTGWGHDSYKPAFKYAGGVWKIPMESIDALAAGQDASQTPQFIPAPAGRMAWRWTPSPGRYGATRSCPRAWGHPTRAPIGRSPMRTFAAASARPLQRAWGGWTAVDFTVKGTNLQTEILNTPNALWWAPSESTALRLVMDPDVVLAGPAD